MKESIAKSKEAEKHAMSRIVYSFALLAAVSNHCRAQELCRVLLVGELTPV